MRTEPKKLVTAAMVLAAALVLASCGKKNAAADAAVGVKDSAAVQNEQKQAADQKQQAADQKNAGDNQKKPEGSNPAPKGAETGEDKLRKAVTSRIDSEGRLFISVQTSAVIGDNGWLGYCPFGIYLTEEIADEADIDYARPLTESDDGWVEGAYTFTFDADSLLPDTYTMVLCDDDDSGNVIGEWIFDVRRNGNVELGFLDSWLIGAGENAL